MDREHLEKQFLTYSQILIKEKNSQGFWTGRLSSSALATSVSIVTFKLDQERKHDHQIFVGLTWLYHNINIDGGYGDSPESESNVSTTLLCYAAISFCTTESEDSSRILAAIVGYLNKQKINLQSENITRSILDFYGKDLTFSVPILSMLSICGILDGKGLKKTPQLPFELALLPHNFYKFFNLQVVSYAIPALIAVGIYLFKHKKSRNPITKIIRNKSLKPALNKLKSLMPESGGFLEAIPLTAFTSMCLIKSGYSKNIVVEKAICFLENQQRLDGSWPIDTDLSTWVTTLSIKALGPELKKALDSGSVQILKNHLLNIQYKEKHPFNMASPGGWGWTNYSGSVPDADDTPGAILALLEMYEGTNDETLAILGGCEWLLGLQNRDGGIPTFCKGWGRLPFDQSCCDLTGHALLAWVKSLDKLGDKIQVKTYKKISYRINRAVRYLEKKQKRDGSWLPLWFGSQHTKDKHNPVYGTSRVATYIQDCMQCQNLDQVLREKLKPLLLKAAEYLRNQQNVDGSWGACKESPGTIEETSLVAGAISSFDIDASIKGLEWIERKIAETGLKANPIGLYFASLWYDEKLYPLTFYIDALQRVLSVSSQK
jgi:prenyltransferase beta subunit